MAVAETEGYQFYGRHLIAQYYGCDYQALSDTDHLSEIMKQAVIASGAQLLGSEDHRFDGSGYSMVLLLSESHASVHTYPEHRRVSSIFSPAARNVLLKSLTRS